MMIIYYCCKSIKVKRKENGHETDRQSYESLNTDMNFLRVWREALTDVKMIKLGWFSCFEIALEWWAFEVVTVICGLMGHVELGAQSVAFNFNALVFQCAFGMSAGTSTMIGGCIANDKTESAKR